MRNTLKMCGLIFASSAAAQETAPVMDMTNPDISSAAVDWSAVRTAIAGLDQLSTPDEAAGASNPDALSQLNATFERIFPNIAASPVPALLPFDPAPFLSGRARRTIRRGSSARSCCVGRF